MPENVKQQYEDNKRWIEQAEENKLVVGTQVFSNIRVFKSYRIQARILYSDRAGRIALAKAFNALVKDNTIKVIVLRLQAICKSHSIMTS